MTAGWAGALEGAGDGIPDSPGPASPGSPGFADPMIGEGDGELVRLAGAEKTTHAAGKSPRNVIVDRRGNLWTANFVSGDVSKFTPDG